MATCDHCNAHVTDAYHRAYSIDGTLYACWECAITGHVDDAIRRRCPDLEVPSQTGTTSPVAVGTRRP